MQQSLKLELDDNKEVQCRAILINSKARREKTAAILERRLQGVRDGFKDLRRSVENGYYKAKEDIRVAAEKVLAQKPCEEIFRVPGRRPELYL